MVHFSWEVTHIFQNLRIFKYYWNIPSQEVWANYDGPSLFTCFGGSRKCGVQWAIMPWFQGSARWELLSHKLGHYSRDSLVLHADWTSILRETYTENIGARSRYLGQFGKLTIVAWDDSLLPGCHQAIITAAMVLYTTLYTTETNLVLTVPEDFDAKSGHLRHVQVIASYRVGVQLHMHVLQSKVQLHMHVRDTCFQSQEEASS